MINVLGKVTLDAVPSELGLGESVLKIKLKWKCLSNLQIVWASSLGQNFQCANQNILYNYLLRQWWIYFVVRLIHPDPNSQQGQVKNMFCTKRLQYDNWERGLNCDHDIFFTEVSNFDQCVSDF